MKNYVVRYSDGIDSRNDITYGIFQAKNEFDAIEEIIKHDSLRKIYDKTTDLNQRHFGMSAEEAVDSTPKDTFTIEQMQSMEVDANNMQANFNALESLYEETVSKLEEYALSASFGAIFRYTNSEPEFIPIFSLRDSLEKDKEQPHSMTLNFDKKLLAFWITSMQDKVVKLEDEPHE